MNKFCNTLYILFLYLENISNGLLQTRQAFFPHSFQSMQQPLQKQSSDKSLQKKSETQQHAYASFITQITSRCKSYQKQKKTLAPAQPYSVAVLGKMNKILHLFLALQGEAAGSGQVHLHVKKNPHCHFSQVTAL